MHIEETEEWQVPGAFEDIASKLLWVAANSTALQVLIVELRPNRVYDHGTGTFRAPKTHYKLEWVHALAEQLAASRPRLRAFGCRPRDLNTFPVIPNLKHLMLDLRFVSLENGVGSLAALTRLETLHLRGHLDDDRILQPPFVFDCPPLVLSSLSRLLRLALVGIRPESIFVSSCCAVHVKFSACYIGSHPVWSAFCSDALRSITWFGASSQADASIVTPQDIPRAMREASCLDRVHIHFIKMWSCEKPSSALARVRILTLSSERIKLCVPAKVQWQHILLYGDSQLDVIFEDVVAFVNTPMNFSFVSKKPFGRSWLPLDTAMVQSKRKWVPMADQVKYRCECEDELKCNCSKDEWHELRFKQFPGIKLFAEEMCSAACGACITCLRGIGSI